MTKSEAKKAIKNARSIYLMGAWTSIMTNITKKQANVLLEKIISRLDGEELTAQYFSTNSSDSDVVISI